jgi:hypothetical protein
MSLQDIENSWLESQTGTLKRTRESIDRLETHVTPVFHVDDDARLQPAGSGVFARLGDRAYLISAAHVLDHCDEGVFVPTRTGPIEPLDNPTIVTGRPPGTSREDDRFDVGFVRLTPSEADDIGWERMVDLEAGGEPMLIETTFFAVLGYPLRDHLATGGVMRGALTSFTTGLADDVAHQWAGLDERSHLLLRFARRDIATKKSHGAPPDMTGLSGGGVWPIKVDVEDAVAQVPFFAGILIEKAARSLVVTRATLIRYFIRRFDATA